MELCKEGGAAEYIEFVIKNMDTYCCNEGLVREGGKGEDEVEGIKVMQA